VVWQCWVTHRDGDAWQDHAVPVTPLSAAEVAAARLRVLLEEREELALADEARLADARRWWRQVRCFKNIIR
jgi:hypothetical protein